MIDFAVTSLNAEMGITLLNQIMSKNHRSKNGKLYISAYLFSFLSGKNENNQYNKEMIDGFSFIEIESIPYEIRMELGLFKTGIRENNLEEETSINLPIHKSTNYEMYAKIDIESALREEKRYLHEFIDYYTDISTVKKKARTLAILIKISKGEKTEEYFQSVYKMLLDLKPDCELTFKNFRDFYKKYKEYQRIGFVQGLLNINFNPNI